MPAGARGRPCKGLRRRLLGDVRSHGVRPHGGPEAPSPARGPQRRGRQEAWLDGGWTRHLKRRSEGSGRCAPPGSPIAASLTPAPPPLPLPPGARPQLQRVQALPFRRCGLVCTDRGREMVEWGGDRIEEIQVTKKISFAKVADRRNKFKKPPNRRFGAL